MCRSNACANRTLERGECALKLNVWPRVCKRAAANDDEMRRLFFSRRFCDLLHRVRPRPLHARAGTHTRAKWAHQIGGLQSKSFAALAAECLIHDGGGELRARAPKWRLCAVVCCARFTKRAIFSRTSWPLLVPTEGRKTCKFCFSAFFYRRLLLDTNKQLIASGERMTAACARAFASKDGGDIESEIC